MAMAAPGLVLLSLFFGFVGLFVGAAFFMLPAALGLVVGVALIAREALRVHWIQKLQTMASLCRLGPRGASKPRCESWA